MIPLYSSEQIRQFDYSAINELGIPGIVLMENAAINISRCILEKFDNIKSVGIVCGKGNNGGDGFAVARHLSNSGIEINCIYLGVENEMSNDCRSNFLILSNLAKTRKNIKIQKFNSLKDINSLRKTDLIIDAILGSGFSGELKEPISSLISKLNSISTKKVAIDVPTGLNADTGFGNNIFHSDLTITLGEFKKGLFISDGYENCGEIYLEEIGVGRDYFDYIDTSTYLIEPEDVVSFLPKRKKTFNKYSAGKVLSIAGSYYYPGAAYLTSGAAFYSGAGASILSVPDIVKKYVYKNLPEVVVEVYGDNKSKFVKAQDYDALKNKIKWADVVAIGSGLGREEETQKFVNLFLKNRDYKFCVIDADALFAIKDNLRNLNLSNCILTPHLGEFSQLINLPTYEIIKDILNFGSEFSKKYKTTLVLKGAPTIIFSKFGRAFINTSGNNGLAKFGSGDVLTGIISGILSQSKDILHSAISGVYIQGLAADLLKYEKTEYCIMSSELMKNIPNAIKFLRSNFDK